MKCLYQFTFAILLSLPISMASLAAEPLKTPEPAKSMDKPHAAVKTDNLTKEQKAEQLKSLQDHIKKSREITDKITAEKDPVKKEELKKQLLELMKARRSQMVH